jgi:hypothetical protein
MNSPEYIEFTNFLEFVMRDTLIHTVHALGIYAVTLTAYWTFVG